MHQSFIAAERAQPVTGRCFTGGKPQVGQQIADRAAAHDVKPIRNRCPFDKVKMAIDETGCDGAPGQTNQMSPRADQRLEIVEGAMSEDDAAGDRNRIAPRMAQDDTLVQDHVGLIEGHQAYQPRYLPPPRNISAVPRRAQPALKRT